MRAIKCLLAVVFLAASCWPLAAIAQQPPRRAAVADSPSETAGRAEFRRELRKAATEAAREGTISRRDARRIRVASVSPAFVDAAEELAIIQLAFAEAEMIDVEDATPLPRNADGEIDRAAFPWADFAEFLKVLLPLLLELLLALGVGAVLWLLACVGI